MKRILAILESDDLVHPLSDILGNEYDITFCAGSQQVELLQQEYDCLLLDLLLPEVDGLTLLKRLHRNLPSSVMVLTPVICDTILNDLEKLGVSCVIRIPSPIDYIAEQLKHLPA